MSDTGQPIDPLTDDEEVGHLAEDVGLTDGQFKDAADIDEADAGRPGHRVALPPPD